MVMVMVLSYLVLLRLCLEWLTQRNACSAVGIDIEGGRFPPTCRTRISCNPWGIRAVLYSTVTYSVLDYRAPIGGMIATLWWWNRHLAYW